MNTGFNESNYTKLKEYVFNFEIDSITTSLCHHCTRHVPAIRFFKNGKVYIAKICNEHGITEYLIESSQEFYQSLIYDLSEPKFDFNRGLITEVTDRCNLECPHCYHIPNQNPDISIDDVILKLKLADIDFTRIVLAGAEPTVRPDFFKLVTAIRETFPGTDISVMTNGIAFGKRWFAKAAIESGLTGINIGLNHPSYNDIDTVRRKQESAIDIMHEEQLFIGYVSYTMSSTTELPDILNEIVTTPWTPKTFRVRIGSDIGRYDPTTDVIYLSDLFHLTEKWCNENGVEFRVINPADNNIYHIMVNVGGKIVRLINWCDKYNIDLEFLRSGPWCNFTTDGVTNFLHQIIRRDFQKNLNILLPDLPPVRYTYRGLDCSKKLNTLSDITKNKP